MAHAVIGVDAADGRQRPFAAADREFLSEFLMAGE